MIAAIREAAQDDIACIAARARPADAAEMAALGKTVASAMESGLKVSDWAMTGTLDGVPVCMFGVAPVSLLNGIGAPWMLAAEPLEAAQKTFLKLCRPVVSEMARCYPRLINVVDERNTTAIRWLRWLGFRFDMPALLVGGHPFLPFRRGDW